MVHVPILSHENPKRVLIIGGGDGGVLREICRHKEVEHIDMCEIDDKVCELVQRFEFSTAVSFSDPRLNLVHEDGAKFVKRQGNNAILSFRLRVVCRVRVVKFAQMLLLIKD